MNNIFNQNTNLLIDPNNRFEANPVRMPTHNPNQVMPLRSCVEQALRNYLQTCDKPAPELWEIVFAEVAEPLLKISLEYCRGNQSKAAIMLGISRGTLRKNLKKYGLID